MQVLTPGVYVVDYLKDSATKVSSKKVRVQITPQVHLDVELEAKDCGVSILASGSLSPLLNVQPGNANTVFLEPRVWSPKRKMHLPLVQVQRELAEVWRKQR